IVGGTPVVYPISGVPPERVVSSGDPDKLNVPGNSRRSGARLMPNFEDESVVSPPPIAAPTGEPNDPLQSMLERLDKIGRLPEGWSEHGSPAISPVALASARQLVQQVPELNPTVDSRISAPITVAPLDGGGVLVEYKGPRLDLEI